MLNMLALVHFVVALNSPNLASCQNAILCYEPTYATPSTLKSGVYF